jgi:hypothetical protein
MCNLMQFLRDSHSPGRRPLASMVVSPVRASLALAIALLAAFPVVRFAVIAFTRVNYPFELEWMEGGIVDHIRVVLAGQPLYREPSLAFTPFIYAPAYYYVSAVFSWVFGVGFLVPRLVSLISILACFVLLAYWVRRETGDLLAGLVAAGLFAATYAKTELWFDIARVDSLFLLFMLAGYALARFGHALPSALAAAACLVAAVLTKQVGLALAAPALLYLLLRSPRQGLWAGAAFVTLLGGAFAWLEISSHGWFSFYVLRVPSQHDVYWNQWQSALQTHFWSPAVPMTLAALALVLGLVGGLPRSAWFLYSTWIVAAVATSLSSVLHTGGYPNVLMPGYLALAVASGITFAWFRRQRPLSGRLLASRIGGHLFAIALIPIQIGLLSYKPSDALPTREDADACRQMLSTIRASPGPVWMVSSGFYPYLAQGAPVTAHALALVDVFKSRDESVKTRLREHLFAEIRSKKFRTIVLDRANGFMPGDIIDEIKRVYRFKGRIFTAEQNSGWPKVGASIRPDELWGLDP